MAPFFCFPFPLLHFPNLPWIFHIFHRGFGDIAQHTARLCRAFGMRVMAWRNRKNLPGNDLADIVTYASDGPSAKEDVGQGGLKWKDVLPVQLERLKWVRKISMC